MNDRKLDALIAEKVMGLFVHDDERKGTFVAAEERIPVLRRELAHYSTDIAAAWEVKDKICSLPDFTFTIELKDNKYRVNFYRWYPSGKTKEVSVAEADIAPRAICLAALKAIEK